MIMYLAGAIIFLFFICLVTGMAAGILSIDLKSELKKSDRLNKEVKKYSKKTANLKSAVAWFRNENRNMSGVLSELIDSEKLTRQELVFLLKKQSEKDPEEQKMISNIIKKVTMEV
ncbi:MAG: hypothetical protein C0603_03345 [Denitrovibrio sp.]|nr:MAG: hypothetical protein C0603_03345 [Denitrovibrio sp.]